MLFLLVLILGGIGTGFYFRINNDTVLGDRILGISVLAFAFILMPIFLVVRWRGKKLEDYTLSDKNIKKMKEKGLDDVLVTGGGIIPDADMEALSAMGIGKLFAPGAHTRDIVSYITDWVETNRNF